MKLDKLVDGAWYLVEAEIHCPYLAMIYSAENKGFLDHNAERYLVNEMVRWARINPEEIFNNESKMDNNHRR